MKSTYLVLLLLSVNCSINLTNTTRTLKLVQILFRHGDRTPTETYLNDPYQYWPEGWGSLTNIGKTQTFKLGQLIRETYKDFLPERYTADSLYVRSAAKDRCIMSAQTLLAGLYPPIEEQLWNPNLLWQPIPVKYVPRHEDDIIAMKKSCPVYETALKRAYESPRIQKINEENKDLYNYLSSATGNKIYDINQLEYLYNTLDIEMSKNLTLPEWTNNVSFTKMLEIAKLNYEIFTDTALMKRLSGGVFLNKIISYISKKINKTSNLDMVLYSGHDLTIVTVTRTLEFEQFSKPKYGAYIIFELYENSVKEYEVQFLYGDDFETPPKIYKMKYCPTPCTLKKFVDGYKNVLPENWDAECNSV